MLKVAPCTVGRTVVRSYSRSVVQSFGRTSQFFRLDGSLLFFIIMGLRSASSAIMFHMMYRNKREMQNNARYFVHN